MALPAQRHQKHLWMESGQGMTIGRCVSAVTQIFFRQALVLFILFSTCQRSGTPSGSCRTPGALEALGVTFGRLPV